MKRLALRITIPIGLAALMVIAGLLAGYLAYRFKFGEGSILATIATLGFMYTIIKPISNDVDEGTKKKKILKVCSIYAKKESDFANEINSKIELLVENGSTIVNLDVLSTKRAIIQYYEK